MTDSKTTTFLMVTTDKTHVKRYGENPLNDREAPKTVTVDKKIYVKGRNADSVLELQL